MWFKKHVEQLHDIGKPHKKAIFQVAIRVGFPKLNQITIQWKLGRIQKPTKYLIKLQHSKWIYRVQKPSKHLICYSFFY